MVLIAYGSRTADVPQLRKNYARFKLSFTHLEHSFFDLYSDLLYTQNKTRQKYYLPVTGSFGLKNVSEFLGYPQPELNVTHGLDALFEYEEFLRKRSGRAKEKIREDLLIYNKDDLNRTKFIFDKLKMVL